MKVSLISAAGITKRALPATAAATLAALSVGAVAGYSAGSAHHVTPKRGFSLRVAPAPAAVRAGSAVRYRITIHRHRFAGRVTLRISPRPPSGTRAKFSPAKTRRSSSTLTILTGRQMLPGAYRIHLRAKGGKLTRSSWLTLTIAAPHNGSPGPGTGRGNVTPPPVTDVTAPPVSPPPVTPPPVSPPPVTPPPFTIAGNVAGPLQPGAPQPINLQITNPNASPLVVENLSASVSALSAPRATASLPCTLSDFSVQAFSGPLPLTIPASSTRSLAELGIPAAQWPQLSLLDLPTDQNGCQAASLTLAYGGNATAG
ncbi:MAG: hypothetical protein ACRDNK_17415 [Solirubrobacteraceae bacterium]